MRELTKVRWINWADGISFYFRRRMAVSMDAAYTCLRNPETTNEDPSPEFLEIMDTAAAKMGKTKKSLWGGAENVKRFNKTLRVC